MKDIYKKIFEAEVELRGSRAHWLVGAGFENPGERVVRMYAKKEGRYLELIEEGYSHMEAMDEVMMSSPRHRGDQTSAREGITSPLDDLGD
tara:strand:+ start:453 stop:725 length:273 start_codon:yes stop_codon:yes gene_type:complete